MSQIGIPSDEDDQEYDDYDYKIKDPKILVFMNSSSLKHSSEHDPKVSAVEVGVKREFEHLENWLKSYRYDKNDIYKEANRKTFDDVLMKYSTNADNCLANYDALIVCVLGIAGDLDLVCLQDETITLDDLISPFKGDRCSSLVDKPKLFLIQVFTGVPEYKKDQATVDRRVLPVDADIFVAFGQIPHDWEGPTMMSSLTDMQTSQPYKELNNLSIDINKALSVSENGEKLKGSKGGRAFSCISSTLTKIVYLKLAEKVTQQIAK